MKSIGQFVKNTIIGGLLLMIPLVCVILVGGKALQLVRKLISPITNRLQDRNIAGVGLGFILTAVVLIFLCFIAGLLMKTPTAKKFKQFLENQVLVYIPGYFYIQAISNEKLDTAATSNWKPAVFIADENETICFVTDESPGHYSIYIPACPSPSTGSVVSRKKEDVRLLPITVPEALSMIRQFGKGAATAVEKRMPN
ncbi:hypothetical protein [Flavihumibacter petaseus]|uniref:DUF502 domain-containing protein n=1 Tax=Flavihumibacter petaseus NBRC 106054 TaxID=1220578 RepID=A0A0E9MXZ1_9BACT|nr:hypothetical protein [Flavihumibacter petaseus]GAO42597.1 hypothetical protein FPE01S_01_16120 [Flavihumibacter petaseus NBRC 106054]